MRIDFYISSLSGGGAENVLIMIAKEFAKNDNQTAIISLEKREQFYEIPSGIELLKFNNKSKNKIKEFIRDFRTVKKQLKVRKADVAISFLSRCNLLLLLASFFVKSRIVVCDRNNPLKEHSKLVFKLSCRLYKRAQKIVVQTEQIKQMYPEYLQNKIVVIENPLDINKMDEQIADRIPEKENTVISVGRLEKQKDFKTLIQAFHEISCDNPDWKLKIFGVGNMKDELQNMIDTLGESERILLCGHTKQPFYEMKKSKIFVLSSYYEGFPNVLCEAMYAGLACISTDCVSGPRELINDGENGFLVPIEDVSEIKNKMELLIRDPALREKMGEKAIQECQRLHIDKIMSRWSLMVKEITEKNK